MPAVLLAVLAVLVLIHLAGCCCRRPRRVEFLLLFAFIPARYDTNILADAAWPGGLAADVWTFVTYALIHADWMHLGSIRSGCSLSARRWRAGSAPVRFLAFCAVTAAAGALAHLMTHFGQMVPMVGASATISGMMAAAMRFAFQRGGPLGLGGSDEAVSCAGLAAESMSLRDPRVLAFIAVWFGLNLLFGIGSVSITGDEQTVAWQAHVGGFIAGLLLFSWFDPVGSAPERERPCTPPDALQHVWRWPTCRCRGTLSAS